MAHVPRRHRRAARTTRRSLLLTPPSVAACCLLPHLSVEDRDPGLLQAGGMTEPVLPSQIAFRIWPGDKCDGAGVYPATFDGLVAERTRHPFRLAVPMLGHGHLLDV